MSEPTGQPQGGQQPTTDPDAQPQGGAQQQPTHQPGQQPSEPPQGDSTDWKAEARKWEDRAKRDAAKAKANADAAQRLTQLEDANKSETEKLLDRATKAEERAQQAEERYRTATIRSAVIDAATTAHAVDAETVYLHLQARGGIDLDDNGTATGVDAAVKQLAKDKPHLFSQAAPGSRDANSHGTPPALNSDTLEQSLRRAVGAR